MASSDRIRAPLRANTSRMLAEADTTNSTPEFVIRRNLIFGKRSTSVSEEGSSSLSSQLPAVANQAFKADDPQGKGVHPSPQGSRDVAAAPSTLSAPPWNGQLRTTSPKTRDVGRGRGSGKTLSLTLKGDNMGEESCYEHARADEPAQLELTKVKENDPQEFRYGPGFVDRLKSRFISLSLQEKPQSLTGDSAIRRYSSLENVLEQDEYSDFDKRKRSIGSLTYTNNQMPNLLVPSRNNFKRAKSMETLLLESEHNMRHKNLANSAFTNNNNNNNNNNFNRIQRPLSACDPISGSVLINENLVIIDTLPENGVDLTSRIPKKTPPSRQYSLSGISDEELPKPDIVKTCKLIFETASKRPASYSNNKKAAVMRPSAKVLKDLPVQSPSNQPLGIVQQSSIIPPAPPQPNLNHMSIAQKNFGAKDNLLVANGTCPPVTHDTSPKTLQQKEANVTSNNGIIRTHPPSIVTFNGKQKTKTPVGQTRSLKSSQTIKPTTPPPPPPVARSVVNKDLTKQELKQPQLSQETAQNAEPVKPVSPTTAAPNGLPASVALAVGSESERIMKTPNRVIGTDSFGESSTDDVNFHNEDLDKEEDFLKPTPLSIRNKPGGLWQKSTPSGNTVVFDFRGKEVKSHLPANPAPFGCKPVKKAKKQEPSVAGNKGALTNGTPDPATTILLGDFGESHDWDEEYDSDELDIGANLPAISGINFVGENTKCGRSALLRTRNKKLKIRFVESVTRHEYPSGTEETEPSWSPQEDASLTLAHLVNGDIGPPNGALPPTPPDEEETGATLRTAPAPPLRQNMGLASTGGLSTYTPSMLSSASESFQLGVERLSHTQSQGPDETQGLNGPDPTSTSSSKSSQEDEELKPGDPADMSSWSSSTTTSDLLF